MTRWKSLLIVGVAVLTVFGQTVGTGFVWDDVVLVQKNEFLRGADAWSRALTHHFWDVSGSPLTNTQYWRPMVTLSYVALQRVGHGAPWPYHLFNTVLHAATSLLVFEWLRRRLSQAGAEPSNQAALAGALVFGLHPSRFESVGWVSCSTELIFGFFAVLAALSLERPRPAWSGVLALGFAALSKETAVVLPVLFALDALARGLLRERWRWLVASLAVLSATLVVRNALGLGHVAIEFSEGLSSNVQRFVAAFGAYHLRSVVPLDATVVPFELTEVSLGLFDLPRWLLVVGALCLVSWFAFAAATVRSPRVRPLVADAVWWLVPLLPVTQFVRLPSPMLVSDRFLYLPMLGAAALVARLFTFLATRETTSLRRAWLLLGGALAAASLLLTVALPCFRSNYTFYEREFELHPRHAFTADNYARALLTDGHPDAAVLITEAARVYAGEPQSRRMAITHAIAFANAHHDTDPRELSRVVHFLSDLIAQRPATWVMGTVPTHFSADDDREVLGGFDAQLVRQTNVVTQARLGNPAPMRAFFEAQRARRPSPELTVGYATSLALAGEWAGARAAITDDLDAWPQLAANPIALLIREGAELDATPLVLNDQPVAIEKAKVLGRLGFQRYARAALARFDDGAPASQALLDARVQIEIDDKQFDRALKLLEEARAARPGDATLADAQAEVTRAREVWTQLVAAELAVAAPLTQAASVTDRIVP